MYRKERGEAVNTEGKIMRTKKYFMTARYAAVAVLAGGLSLFVSTVSEPAFAGSKELKPANFPTRPFTIVVCYGKGGGSDQAVSALVGKMSEIMGVKVNKPNQAGAGGMNCLPPFKQTPADGYTVISHGDAIAAKYVLGIHDLDPTRDLVPLAIVSVAPSGMFIKGGDERFMTDGKPDWLKVVALAKAKPGKMTVSLVNDPMEQILVAKLEEHFGIKLKQVYFDKGGERYGSVIGGKIDLLVEQPGDVGEHVKAGTLAPVISVWPERFKMSPDTPSTRQDFGMEWEPLLRFRVILAKSDTPYNIVRYLEAVIKEAYDSPEYQKFIKKKNLDIVPSYYGVNDTEKILRQTIDDYTKALK